LKQKIYPGAYAGNKYAFELQNEMMGWLHSADGGQASTEVVQERVAGGYPVRKHPGNVKFDDITISCGSGLSPKFYQWIQDSVDYKHSRREGAIITANYDFKEVSRLTFMQGLITEVSFPALDAASKDACKLTIKLSPEKTDMSFSKGDKSILPVPVDGKSQKQWLPANFRVKIDGLDCRRVSKVEALTVKQKVVENPVGEFLVPDREAVQLDFPNLIVTIPEIDAEGWYKWHKSFVIDGKSDPSAEKGGSIEYLAPDTKTVLGTLEFYNLGIIKFTPDKMEPSDKLRMVKIEMYCEKMTANILKLAGQVAAAGRAAVSGVSRMF
jgi:phage tail-like protein